MADLLNDRLTQLFSGDAQADGDSGTADQAQEDQQQEQQQTTQTTQSTATGGRPPAVDPRVESLIREVESLKSRPTQSAQPERQLTAEQWAKWEKFQQLEKYGKDDPVAIAETFGYKPDEYASRLSEYGAMTPERRRIQQLESEIAETKKWRESVTQQSTQQAQQQREVSAYNHIADHARAGGETYDLVTRSPDGIVRTMNLIKEHHARTGEVLDLDAALSQVETELLDKVYAPLYDSPKVRARLQPAKPGTTSRKAPEQASARTSKVDMSDDERYKAAGEMFLSGFRR